MGGKGKAEAQKKGRPEQKIPQRPFPVRHHDKKKKKRDAQHYVAQGDRPGQCGEKKLLTEKKRRQ